MGAKYEAYIESEADGLDISVLAVVPDETPYKGILQLVHGMSEYKERYLPFMEYMAKKGYVCVIHDHRGHGKSVRALDDLGYMYGGGADAILKDIEVVNREMHQQLPVLQARMGQDLLEKQLPIWKVLCLDQPTRVKLSKPFPLPEM